MHTHPVFRILLGCAFTLLTTSLALAQPGEELPPPLPEGLKHVPLDAMGFSHVRVGDFLKAAQTTEGFTAEQRFDFVGEWFCRTKTVSRSRC